MSYHESFRVAVAVAAPVIALANTVSITDAVTTWLSTDTRRPNPVSRVIYFVVVSVSVINFLIQAAALYIIAKPSLRKRPIC
jgi:hypothetical protein